MMPDGPPGTYFTDATDACNWLPFDAPETEREQAAWATPDTYDEWQIWCQQHDQEDQ